MLLQTGASGPAWAPDFLFRPSPIVWVQQLFGPGNATTFELIDLLASTWGALFAVALGLWLWGRDDAYALAMILVAEALINLALNQLLDVPRPSAPEVIKYEQVGLGSFPSGHVFTATALWGLLWARGRVPLWLAALVVTGVGVGRLYLGVHYLADVVAGAVLGALLVWVFRRVWPRVRGWLAERSYGFYVGAGVLTIAAVGAGLFLMGSQSHFMYNAAAIAAGGIAAMLIECRWVHFDPADGGGARAFTKVLVGLLGLAPLLAVDRMTGEGALWVGAALALVGSLWALLGAPALFRWWGWGAGERRTSASPTGATRGRLSGS